jgi:hypothetical protein
MARTEASERLENLISMGFPSNRRSDEISRLRDIQENPLSEEIFKEITTAFALASDSEKPDIAKFFFNQKAILTKQLSDYECTREYGFSSDFPWETMKYKILFLLREYGDQATSIEATKAFINIARNDLSLDRVPEPASVVGFWNDFRQRTWKSDEALEVWSLALGFVREQDPSFRPDLDRIFKYLRSRPKGAAVEESSLVVPPRINSSTTQSPTNSPLVNTPTAWMASDYLYWIRWFLILVCTAFGLYFFTGVDSSFFRSLGAVVLCMFAIRSIAGAESRQESWGLGIAGALVAVAWLIH